MVGAEIAAGRGRYVVQLAGRVGELDFIFIISTYHHFDDPVTLLRNARASLKPDGM